MGYKFRKRKTPPRTADFWYDLNSGGYLKAEDFSKDPETIKAINDALKLIAKCEEMCEFD